MRLLFSLVLLWSVSAIGAENLIENSGFEVPFVSARTPKEHGGDPTGQNHGWLSLDFLGNQKGGAIVAGLTNEVHHDGRQSFFVQFNHVSQAYQAAILTSGFMPVAPGTDYLAGIWGRIDSKNPLTGDGRSAYLKMQVDYFAKDANTSVGETVYAVQPLPGSKDHPAFFVATTWSRFFVKITTPPDAVFAQVTYRWETGSNPGETNGVMFFDDAFLFGPPAADPNMTPFPIEEPAAPADDTSSAGMGTPAKSEASPEGQ